MYLPMTGGTKAKHSGAMSKADEHDSKNPFCAVHPDLASRRNQTQAADAESIPLGPAQEVHRREHANPRALLRAKKAR
jgi:hypothetical protein